jgi:hypothetical protein
MHHCIIVVTSKNNESPIGLQFDRSYLIKRIMEFFRWSTLVVFTRLLYLIYFIFWKETTVMRLWGAVNNVATKCSAGWREHGEAGDVVAKCL